MSDSSLDYLIAKTRTEAPYYDKTIGIKPPPPATYTKDKHEITSAPTEPTSFTWAFMPLVLLGTSMAGLATHSWPVFIVTSIIAWAALYQTEIFIETKIGKKVAAALRYFLGISAALGLTYISYNEWGWQGVKWSVIVFSSLAAIAGLNHFFTKTKAGGKTVTFIAYLITCAAFMYIAYEIIINS